MSSPITVHCPNCEASLKLRSEANLGKRVRCPKCQKPFTLEAPVDEDLEFLEDFSEDDYSDEEWGDDDYGAPAPSRPARAARANTVPMDWRKPAIIAGCVVVALLMVGGVAWVMKKAPGLIGNSIDISYLPKNSEFVGVVNVNDVWNADLLAPLVSMQPVTQALNEAQEETGLRPENIESVTMGFGGISQALKNQAFRGGPPTQPSYSLVVRTNTAVDKSKFPLGEAKSHKGQEYHLVVGPNQPSAVFFPDSKTIVMCAQGDITSIIESGTDVPRRPEFDFVDSSMDAYFAFVPSDPSMFDQVPVSPDPQAAAVMRASQGKLRGAAIGLSVSSELKLLVQCSCKDSTSAAAISGEVNKLIDEGRNQFNQVKGNVPPMFSEFVNLADEVLSSINSTTDGEIAELSATVPASAKATLEKLPGLVAGAAMMQGLGNMFGGGGGQRGPGGGFPGGGGGSGSPGAGGGGRQPGLNNGNSPSNTGNLINQNSGNPSQGGSANPLLRARAAARRAQCQNNMKQIVVAVHNYHDANGHFPTNIVAENGTPLLSWRIELLPYLGHEDLYNQFQKSEPWNSPTNQALVGRIPPVLQCPSGSTPAGQTTYVGPSGPGTLFESGAAKRMRDITDGTANTALLVDSTKPVVWTQPVDLAFNPGQPRNNLFGRHPEGTSVATVSGSVLFVPQSIPDGTISALMSIGGGEAVDLNF